MNFFFSFKLLTHTKKERKNHKITERGLMLDAKKFLFEGLKEYQRVRVKKSKRDPCKYGILNVTLQFLNILTFCFRTNLGIKTLVIKRKQENKTIQIEYTINAKENYSELIQTSFVSTDSTSIGSSLIEVTMAKLALSCESACSITEHMEGSITLGDAL